MLTDGSHGVLQLQRQQLQKPVTNQHRDQQQTINDLYSTVDALRLEINQLQRMLEVHVLRFCRAMLCKRGLCRRAVSVCTSRS